MGTVSTDLAFFVELPWGQNETAQVKGSMAASWTDHSSSEPWDSGWGFSREYQFGGGLSHCCPLLLETVPVCNQH